MNAPLSRDHLHLSPLPRCALVRPRAPHSSLSEPVAAHRRLDLFPTRYAFRSRTCVGWLCAHATTTTNQFTNTSVRSRQRGHAPHVISPPHELAHAQATHTGHSRRPRTWPSSDAPSDKVAVLISERCSPPSRFRNLDARIRLPVRQLGLTAVEEDRARRGHLGLSAHGGEI